MPLSATPLVFAYLPAQPTLLESVGFQINGLIVVLVALSFIWLTLEVMGFYFRRAAQTVASTQPSPASVPPAAPAAAGLPPEVVAAITVAVHETLGERARVHAIVPVPVGAGWAHEGRRQIFSSHQPR